MIGSILTFIQLFIFSIKSIVKFFVFRPPDQKYYTTEITSTSDNQMKEEFLLIRRGKKYSPSIFTVFSTEFHRIFYENDTQKDHIYDYLNYKSNKINSKENYSTYYDYLSKNHIKNIPILIFNPIK